MAKVKGPFFSLAARKTFAKILTFQERLGGTVVYQKSQPGDVEPLVVSQAQYVQRQRIGELVGIWQGKTVEQKNGYNELAKQAGFHGTGYSYFMHLFGGTRVAPTVWKQGAAKGYGFQATPRTVQYSANVTAGALLTLSIATEAGNSLGTTVTVTDDQNGVWTRASDYAHLGTRDHSIWYRKNSVGGVKPIVTVTVSQTCYLGLAANEFTGDNPSGVTVDGKITHAVSSNPILSGLCPVSGPKRLVVASCGQGSSVNTNPTVALPFLIGASQPNGTTFEACTSAYLLSSDIGVQASFTYPGPLPAPAAAVSFIVN